MKKRFVKGLTVLGMICAFVACSSDDDNNNENQIDASDLPAAGIALLEVNFEGATVTRAEKKKTPDEDGTLYEVTLSNGFEIDLDAQGNWTDIDGNGQQVPDALVPDLILSYTQENYQSLFIESIDMEVTGYDVELSDGTDLEFDTEGNFVRVDS
ncbi:Putative beta-lactamase-inhibitor-like, PepSY-like [Sinomicrobium oceani]|uniref:Putative beta-lactamase-inhibitor-like, PepSY-like n=1 Tax=Sinomicrobium oceani TaxID=1150368 RepID=A0A1K1RZN0_9FLAO|nr:PepSY-like domain-containing protein [Sinomicrobium oceani]SFW77277.1 Putative beta-lactamase-inhibitor-like, PepSY-like [Sinomicrobium oceani]